MQAGFNRASENLGAAHCGHMACRGPGPTEVLHICKIAGGCPLPSFGRQGRRAQPPGDPRGLSNPACSKGCQSHVQRTHVPALNDQVMLVTKLWRNNLMSSGMRGTLMMGQLQHLSSRPVAEKFLPCRCAVAAVGLVPCNPLCPSTGDAVADLDKRLSTGSSPCMAGCLEMPAASSAGPSLPAASKLCKARLLLLPIPCALGAEAARFRADASCNTTTTSLLACHV